MNTKNHSKKTTKTTGKRKGKSPYFLEGFNSKASNKMFKMFKAQATTDGERSVWKSVLGMAPFKRDNSNND